MAVMLEQVLMVPAEAVPDSCYGLLLIPVGSSVAAAN